MKKHISFPEIEQFRNITAQINREYNFIGLDEKGEAIYDPALPKPKLTFLGTVKLHGTNASLCFNDIDGMWAQSRTNILTVQKDNAAFCFFVESKKDAFTNLFNQIKQIYFIDTSIYTVTIYGEWVGKGIQKGVAIAEIDKAMFIFAVKISKPDDKEFVSYWLDSSNLRDIDNRIFNIFDYKTYSIEIDFNTPELSQNRIIEMTAEVEAECPVAKEFGISGIGEGIVFSHMTEKGKVLRFKSKGEKHSKSKIKKLNLVDDDKINKVIEVVNKVTPIWRLEQMFEKQFDIINTGGKNIDRSKLGDYIRLVINDILKEELNIISAAGLEPKDINKYVSDIARKYFFEQEQKYLI